MLNYESQDWEMAMRGDQCGEGKKKIDQSGGRSRLRRHSINSIHTGHMPTWTLGSCIPRYFHISNDTEGII